MKHFIITFLSSLTLLLPLIGCKNTHTVQDTAKDEAAAIVPLRFNADSALLFVKEQCAFGARVPNSKAHDRCVDYIAEKFHHYGLQVDLQKIDLKAWDGKILHTTNIIASYRPQLKRRVVLAAHYDSRPWCDQDPDTARHHDPVMAANDGASGIAVLLEVARQLQAFDDSLGVDFVCFDSEDYGAPYWGKGLPDDADWCMGSRYWAQHLPKDYRPEYGILLDMVGGANSEFRFEYFSMQYAKTIVARVWSAAQRAGAGRYFVMRDGGAVTDDHVPVNKYARFPMIDIIGSEGQNFPHTWHTIHDTPENISSETLEAVGQTLLQTLYETLNP